MGGTFQNTPPGNAVRGFYEVSKVLPFSKIMKIRRLEMENA